MHLIDAANRVADDIEMQLDVVAQGSFIDVLAAGFDAGVRYDERLEQDMIAVPIGSSQLRAPAARQVLQGTRCLFTLS